MKRGRKERGKRGTRGEGEEEEAEAELVGLCLLPLHFTVYRVSRGTYLFTSPCLSALAVVCDGFHLMSSCMPMGVCFGPAFSQAHKQLLAAIPCRMHRTPF